MQCNSILLASAALAVTLAVSGSAWAQDVPAGRWAYRTIPTIEFIIQALMVIGHLTMTTPITMDTLMDTRGIPPIMATPLVSWGR